MHGRTYVDRNDRLCDGKIMKKDNAKNQKALDISGKRLFDILYIISLITFTVFLILQPTGLQSEVIFQRGHDFLADFLNSVRHVAGGQPYLDGHIQPPLGFLLIAPFRYFADFTLKLEALWKTPMAIFSALLFVSISEVWLFFMLKKSLKKFSGFPVLLWLFLSGINIFAMERGTVVIFSAGCIAGFLTYYDSEKKCERMLSYFLLAAAFSLKLYPALFGLLLLKRRDYKGALYSMLFGILLTFPMFLFFDGGFDNIPVLWENLHKYRGDRLFQVSDFKIIHIFTPMGINAQHKAVFDIIRRVVDGITILCCAAVFFSRKDEKLIFNIACLLILCPLGAGIYTMLYLAVPFLKVYQNDNCRNFVTLCWVILLTPLRFEIPSNDFLCPFLLVVLLIYNVYEQIKQRDFVFLSGITPKRSA